jgi:hypothetical protein
MTGPGWEPESLDRWEEGVAMGGPWREREFDPVVLRSARPYSGRRGAAVAMAPVHERLGKVVLVYIAAVVMSFGLMLSLMQLGW